MLIYGLDKGVSGSWLGCRQISASRQISKNRKFFFSFSLQNMKNPKILKIEYISAAHRVNLPRLGIYFWTLFCPELVKLQFTFSVVNP
jgi:hypothetical protein